LEKKFVFWDSVHYTPWVYEALNNVLLNVLCNHISTDAKSKSSLAELDIHEVTLLHYKHIDYKLRQAVWKTAVSVTIFRRTPKARVAELECEVTTH
jgi:phospholipase/lecithinase/hemolysin